MLNYKPLGRSLFLLGAVLFVALPCLYGLLWLETRVCLYLSGAIAAVQPDHELLTPEPAAAGAGVEGEEELQPKASPVSLMSPTSMKLAEAEMGVGFAGHHQHPHPGGSIHHRPHPHPHVHMGAVQAS